MRNDDPIPCETCEGTGETYGEVYDGSRWRECGDCDGYGIAPSPWSRRHYLALVEVSQRTGYPQEYREDLTVHDRHACEVLDPAQPFAWVLRESGTHICPVQFAPIDGAETRAWTYIAGFGGARAYFSGACLFYGWDGSRLRPFDTAEALAKWVKGEAYMMEPVGERVVNLGVQ